MNLRPGEKLLFSVRKHWFVIFLEAIVFLIIMIAPLGVFFLASKFSPQIPQVKEIMDFNDQGNGATALVLYTYFLYLLGVWVAFFVAWTDYYLDVWYITSERIIAVDQKGLFRREVIDLRYERVQDSTVEISGVIPTLLNFGDLHIQTAGAKREIILRSANDPVGAKKAILYQHSKALEKIENSEGSP